MLRKYNFVVIDVDAGIALDERRAYALAQTVQLQQHIGPAWDSDSTEVVRVATPDAPARAGEVQIQLIKMPRAQDPSGALGYHDQQPDGTPIIYVFTQLATQYNDAWTSVASHEVCEVKGDPRLRRAVQTPQGFCALEIADAVESDVYLIEVQVDGVAWKIAMSNFCTPAWFEPSSNPIAALESYDYLGKCTHSGEVRPGGYAQYFDPKAGNWAMVNQMRVPGYRSDLAAMGIGRTARRQGPKKPGLWSLFVAWLRSHA